MENENTGHKDYCYGNTMYLRMSGPKRIKEHVNQTGTSHKRSSGLHAEAHFPQLMYMYIIKI